MSADSRSRAQRRRDTEHRLTHDKDVWVASASADGAPYLVPPYKSLSRSVTQEEPFIGTPNCFALEHGYQTLCINKLLRAATLFSYQPQ